MNARATAHGTIVVIDFDPPARLWRRVLWCVTKVERSQNFRVHRWDHDYITREYHESAVGLVAHGIANARALVPVGFVVTTDEGVEGEWYRRDISRLSATVAGAMPRSEYTSLRVRALEGSAA